MRRILRFADDYPTALRVMLATNYRCPEPVVEASARLIETNQERFAKPIRAGALGTSGTAISAVRTDRAGWAESLARLAAAHDAERRTCCFLSRTRSELMPVQLALIRTGTRHATAVPGPAEAESVRRLVDGLRRRPDGPVPFHALLELRGTLGWRRGDPAGDALGDDDHAALDAALGWAVAFPTASAYLAAYDAAVARLAALRDPDAPVELATIHGSKGREWQTVVIVGFEEDRFPNRRALVGAAEPERAVEEERRLAYVALTRATERLILAFDPAKPSRFLAEMGFTNRPG
ncbi:MAG: 3'-5' exonuclease [Candidatus Limnocylindria bacterium]